MELPGQGPVKVDLGCRALFGVRVFHPRGPDLQPNGPKQALFIDFRARWPFSLEPLEKNQDYGQAAFLRYAFWQTPVPGCRCCSFWG